MSLYLFAIISMQRRFSYSFELLRIGSRELHTHRHRQPSNGEKTLALSLNARSQQVHQNKLIAQIVSIENSGILVFSLFTATCICRAALRNCSAIFNSFSLSVSNLIT